MGIFSKIFGTYSEREIKRINYQVDEVEALSDTMESLSDEQLKNKTSEFKERLDAGETLDDLLAEAYAVVREVAVRTIGQKHFRVQIIGAIILHQGRISEMRTGEGKTLTATMPAYLNALTGKGVHVVTVNDYLAEYQSEEMAQIHNFLGVSVACLLNNMDPEERREAYGADITYATNNELGFDYLRDNMVVYEKSMVQRGLNFAIIDEVDSILIDEARTPLIISGSGTKSTQMYQMADSFVKGLVKGRILNEDLALNALTREDIQEEGDFVVDEKAGTTNLTMEGTEKAERFFSIDNLSDPENMEVAHHISNALKANSNMKKDIDYMVTDNAIIIVDEHTGRPMEGRRYSDGLHQAIEAKENVEVKKESQTLATITFQNFFNKYTKKSGMTGTAMTEENEFRQIYGMDVVEIPTNMPMVRMDYPDIVYKTKKGKLNAIIEDIEASHKKGQPVLVGTVSIESSEEISLLLRRKGIRCEVLNAKYIAKEADIIALAGQKDAVTVATNMAGRGTDIILEKGVAALGGLKVVGTERHESRRIDNQLRGRSGRQGDPGESRFYISFEDDLMRLFGSDRMISMVEAIGLDENDPLEHKMLSKSIETAQSRVEGNNFAIRKSLLEYDQVMNIHREVIYGERQKVLTGQDLSENIAHMIDEVTEDAVMLYTSDSDDPNEWDLLGLNQYLAPMYYMKNFVISEADRNSLTRDDLREYFKTGAHSQYAKKEAEFTSTHMREIERIILLQVVDQKWMTHIDAMDYMRQGVRLQSYAQKNPVDEYKRLADTMFDDLMHSIQIDTVRGLFNVRIATQPEKREQVAKPTATNIDTSGPKKPVVRSEDDKVGRNDPCPCGSGKKYKHCHGRGE